MEEDDVSALNAIYVDIATRIHNNVVWQCLLHGFKERPKQRH